jgi:hypothetical protein
VVLIPVLFLAAPWPAATVLSILAVFSAAAVAYAYRRQAGIARRNMERYTRGEPFE